MTEDTASTKDAEGLDPDFEINPKVEGIADVMFRNVVSTHVDFTFIADNKAYVMICANSIIIGALTTVLVPRLGEQTAFIGPTILMFIVNLLSLSFSILSIRPILGKGITSREAILSRQGNMLFFGNFYRMKREEFEWAMREMLKDDNYVFRSMIQDIYYLGRSLGVKYRQVRWSYDIFLFGTIASVGYFVVSVLLGRTG